MLKLLLGTIGLVELLYPDRFVAVLTRFAYDYDGEPPVAKPWVHTAARIEGLVILTGVVYAALRGGCPCGFGRGGDADDERDDAGNGGDTADDDTIDRID